MHLIKRERQMQSRFLNIAHVCVRRKKYMLVVWIRVFIGGLVKK